MHVPYASGTIILKNHQCINNLTAVTVSLVTTTLLFNNCPWTLAVWCDQHKNTYTNTISCQGSKALTRSTLKLIQHHSVTGQWCCNQQRTWGCQTAHAAMVHIPPVAPQADSHQVSACMLHFFEVISKLAQLLQLFAGVTQAGQQVPAQATVA